MVIDSENINNFLETLGFKLRDGERNIYFKSYKKHKDFEIQIKINDSNFKFSEIIWGKGIKVERNTTSNFSQQENFVVLECVNKILDLGYSPKSIVLEKDWKLGHQGKGFLDILIKNKDGSSFLMIECKTWGKEYEKEKENILKDGGQLFSYYIQEKSTKYLCLYTSSFDLKSILYKNEIISISQRIKESKNQKEAFEGWIPQVTETRGLLENNKLPYLPEFTGLTKNKLELLSENDGDSIYKRFLEILRRNVVSDKTNAFNKIFNLFLCKIVDEDKRCEDEEMLFQWKKDEENEDVLMRLNDLYKEGMSEYLELNISAVSEKEIDDSLSKMNSQKSKEMIKKIFIQQKLYSGNEFAFKEVFDKESFDENCIVVKEMVKLLEGFKLKYSGKHQFLGEFFEKLLNDSVKQESGQFFTPLPLTSFICKSLPIKKIIDKKNNNKELNILPYCIDYASGSGHFLTEIMDEINFNIKDISENEILGGSRARSFFSSLKENYLWAKEYIYGIEKDYRLSKTTKINTFLNGDGDANIIQGDGLDSFYKSDKYKGLLKANKECKEIESFDILVSNPPYSISGFKNTVKNGKESFDMFDSLNDKSSEIEILFIERAKQLLREGGVAGLILPDSVLFAPSYKKIRDLILLNFKVRGILELKENAFMETSKNTVVLFLEKEKRNCEAITKIINNFFVNFKDVSFDNQADIFSKYLVEAYNINLGDYISFLKSSNFNEIKDNELFIIYEDLFCENNFKDAILKILEIEKSKLFYFILSNNKIIFAQTGDMEKEFLGYDFHKGKVKMGINVFRDKYNNNQNISALYNENLLLDETKLNYYVLQSFLDNLDNSSINSSISDLVKIRYLSDLFKFDKPLFENQILAKPTLKIVSKFKQESLSKLYNIVDSGSGAPQDKIYFKNGAISFIRAGNLNNKDKFNFIIPDNKSMINNLAVKDHSLKMFPKGAVVFPKTGKSCAKGNIGRLNGDSYVVNHLAVVYDENELNLDFLYYFLEYYNTSNLIPAQSGYPTINLSDIKKLKIPLIDKPLKEKIVKDLKDIDLDNKKNKKELKENYLKNYFEKKYI